MQEIFAVIVSARRNAQASLPTCADSPESWLLAYTIEEYHMDTDLVVVDSLFI